MASRETRRLLEKQSNGTIRANERSRLPLIRMTNINLEPGEATLQQMVAETEEEGNEIHGKNDRGKDRT